MNSDSPLVSAIITTHNRITLVEKAISSVINQTYPNIELIVVDDASTDGTKELLEKKASEYGFKYIYITKQESRGGNYARNVGVRNSKGEYIAFLDDDDEWFPEKTEKQIGLMSQNPNCGVVSCLREYEFDSGHHSYQPVEETVQGDIHDAVFTRIPFTTSTIIVKRAVLEICGLFDENLHFWQEYELSIRICQVTQVDCVPEHLCLYRVINNDKNRLTNKIEGWKEAVQYIEKKHSFLISELTEKDYKKHKIMIAEDGLRRSRAALERTSEIYYLWELLKLKKSRASFNSLVSKLPFFEKLYAAYMRVREQC